MGLRRLLLAAIAAAGVSPVSADVSLPAVLSDGVVLQRDSEAAIWGFASPGEAITVTASWTDASRQSVADDSGRWSVRMPTGAAGGPHTFTAAGHTSVTVRDVLLGEVWVCSGQSNMEWPMTASDGAAEAIAQADHPAIRLFQVPRTISAHPRLDTEARWVPCTPQTVAGFSAVGYHFGRRLHEELGVPVGLIASSWGGTAAESWMRPEALAALPWYERELAMVGAMGDPNARAAFLAARQAELCGAIDAAGAVAEGWQDAPLDDGAWKEVPAPVTLEQIGLGQFDGFVYFRRSFLLDTVGAGVVELGPIDDEDDVWINGVKVGSTRAPNQWNQPRRYAVPPGVLRKGSNVIAARVLDTGGPGAFGAEPALMRLTVGQETIPLAGTWRWTRGAPASAATPTALASINQHSVSSLFNGMIAPIVPHTVAGVIWYQGESNRQHAQRYERVLRGLIQDWRSAWELGAERMAFHIVQIAPFKYQGDAGQTAMVREAQRAVATTEPNCGLAITMDVGDPLDIHPRDKRTVGERLARLALAGSYEQELTPTGPMARSVLYRAGMAKVVFDHAEAGLVAQGGELRHFLLAGHDGVFHVARAVIDGDSVVVTSPSVPEAAAVRYAWDDDVEPGLFNAEGLPASPFRFDDFPINAPVSNEDEMTRLRTREPGFAELFDGATLEGWVNVNCAPDTFTARNGVIHCTGKPTGVIRTAEPYQNFVLELEYRHLQPGGNAGLFIWSDPLTARGQPFTRSVEVQVMDGLEGDWFTSDGDIFPIHGASMTPLTRKAGVSGSRAFPEERRAFDAPLWNHYRVECIDGRVSLAVNGKVVSRGEAASPRRGYICFESEGSPVEFRNIRIKTMNGPALEDRHMAAAAQLFVPLYTGVDLAGWDAGAEHQGHWQPADWVLRFDGEAPDLWSEREYGDFTLIADWRWTAEPTKIERPVIRPSGEPATNADGTPTVQLVDDAGDSGIYLRGSSKSQVNIWCWPIGSGEVYGYRTDASMPAEVRAGVTPREVADAPIGQWNRFVITMVGDRLTVELNGKTVIDRAQLPGVAPRGRIALQSHGSPIEFANLFIMEHGKPIKAQTQLEPGAEKQDRDAAPGADALFNGNDLQGWVLRGPEGAWAARDGAIVNAAPGSGALLRTDRTYRDFDLEFEFLPSAAGSAGVGLRASSNGSPAYSGMELMLASTSAPGVNDRAHGAIWEAIAPLEPPPLRIGEWNSARVRIVGDSLDAWVNGARVHRSAKLDERGYVGEQSNWLPLNARMPTGYITLRDHGREFAFRNLRLADLSPDPEPPGMERLITEDRAGWFATGLGKWSVREGELVGEGGPGHLFTERVFEDFELRALVHVNQRGNSGIYFRVEPNAEDRDSWPTGYEAQVDHHDPKNFTGCVYDRAWPAGRSGPVSRDLAWFDYRVVARGDRIRTWVNGVEMVDAELTDFRRGRIAVQGHHPGNVIRYRDLRVLELD